MTDAIGVTLKDLPVAVYRTGSNFGEAAIHDHRRATDWLPRTIPSPNERHDNPKELWMSITNPQLGSV